MAEKAAARVEEVGPEQAERRLDNFLSTVLVGAPRSLVYRIIRSGEVRVNGRRATPSQRLAAGDKVRIPPYAPAELRVPRIASHVLERVERAILYEDNRVLVLNKPAGLAVHAGSGIDFGLIDIIRALRQSAGKIDLVHRLDRETSGCLLFAKEPVALRALHQQLRDGEMHKAYVALLADRLPRHSIECAAPLAMVPDEHGERRAIVSDEGSHARTEFRIRTLFPAATLAAITLDTGRTHQIRAHALAIGHPVAGDVRYGDADFNKGMRAMGLRRLFLHAERLRFSLERVHDVEAPLPADLVEVLQTLTRQSALEGGQA